MVESRKQPRKKNCFQEREKLNSPHLQSTEALLLEPLPKAGGKGDRNSSGQKNVGTRRLKEEGKGVIEMRSEEKGK